jgi:diguanylate cyclase (GGDEF)-like protein
LKVFKDELEMKLNFQTRLFNEVTTTNEELRKSQKKSKLNHEQLAKQKYDLEVANELLNKMTSEIYTQNELLRYLSSVLDINELLEVVNDAILGTIGVDTCSLVLYNEQNEEFLYNVKSNFPGNHFQKLTEKVEAGALQKYFDSDKIHLNNRVILSDYEFINDRPVGSIAIIPLLRDSVTYGLIIAEHVNTDIFTENNLQFFTGISTQITIAINNANMYALMEEMAIKDGLTGIYNRKYLQDYLASLISPNNTKGQGTYQVTQEIAAALFDIDKFKTVNDRYGHLFGDEAIKMIASKASKYAKMHDGLAARYGGEEFVLIFPNSSLEKCYEIIQMFHKEIVDEVIYCQEKDESVKINVSIGISHYPSIANSTSDLLLRADNAMYYSKQNGRGRITCDTV